MDAYTVWNVSCLFVTMLGNISSHMLQDKEDTYMTFGLSKVVLGIVAVVAGILVLAWPDLLRWVIGIFLIVWGILTWLGKK